ncbi:hypothetical protein GTY65_23290 [Streptomyces sp. SID8379]|uniref:Rv1733c family protein n=1 Tax=unclassified Streptomyces TaxID=2593676 RepID=UPI0007C56E44|nr:MULTISPECIES: hypothetical protein [unclassified Streptomyces]MYW66971.1 hypothetical protein [Streptomyces sp. SID8379]
MTTCRTVRRAHGNPLRRRSDVIEAWAALLLGLLALLVAPAAGAVAGWAAHAEAVRHAREQTAARYPVRARLLADLPEVSTAPDTSPGRLSYPVVVRWTDPAGTVATAVAPVPVGLVRGDRTTVWLDSRGDVTTPPWDTDDIWSHTLATALCVALTTAGLAALARYTLRAVLDRRRFAAWDREWRRLGSGGGHRAV